MNYVIFSYSFPPRCGAETFCSARFASALAEAGHDVTVVTMDHPWAISKEEYGFLVNPAIKIVRVPMSAQPGRRLLSRLRRRMSGHEASDVGACVAALKRTLLAAESPVLVSRSMPEASGIVAWYCRKYAVKWIAHFSDPFPWVATGKPGTLSSRFLYRCGIGWGRRIIRDSDAISVTCDAARRFFSETYGDLFRRKETIVTPHIGEPPLPSSGKWKRDCGGKLVVHAGYLGFSRGVREILEAVGSPESTGAGVEFRQVGGIDEGARPLFRKCPNAGIIDGTSPDLAMSVVAAADVCLIPEMRTALPYSPFLPSKFVYQLFFDVPIVAYSLRDSEMARLAELFPEAGVLFADMEREGSLVEAIRTAASLDKSKIDRSGIRSLFTRKAVAALYS